MKHPYNNNAPWIRLALAVAALSVTVSIGGAIDFLATDYAMVDVKHRAVLIAERKS